jgi:hypothetical protein
MKFPVAIKNAYENINYFLNYQFFSFKYVNDAILNYQLSKYDECRSAISSIKFTKFDNIWIIAAVIMQYYFQFLVFRFALKGYEIYPRLNKDLYVTFVSIIIYLIYLIGIAISFCSFKNKPTFYMVRNIF